MDKMTRFSTYFLAAGILLVTGCASTSPEVQQQLAQKNLVGQWKTGGNHDGWMEITCEGALNMRTSEASIDGGVISKMDERHFTPSPNPYGGQFTYKILQDKMSGQGRPVVMVRPVPESNILKVMQAFSTIVGKDDTVVFKQVESYSCN